MRRLKQSIAILAIATMALMTACGKKTVTTTPIPTTTETKSESDVVTTVATTQTPTTEVSTEASSPEETTPEMNTEEVTTTVKQTEATTTQAATTTKQTEAPTTVKQTQAPTTAKQTEAPTTVKQTQAPTTAKQTEAPTTVKQTQAPTTAKQTEAPTTVKQTQAPTTAKPTEAPTTEAPTTAAPVEYEWGDVITFGSYKGHNLTWTVVGVDIEGYVLVCNNVVDMKAYNTTCVPSKFVDYDKCSLKTWLNSDFKNTAFTSKQKSKIKEIKLIEDYNAIEGNYGNDTVKDLDGNNSDFWLITTGMYIHYNEDTSEYAYFYCDTFGESDLEMDSTMLKGVRPEIFLLK